MIRYFIFIVLHITTLTVMIILLSSILNNLDSIITQLSIINQKISEIVSVQYA